MATKASESDPLVTGDKSLVKFIACVKAKHTHTVGFKLQFPPPHSSCTPLPSLSHLPIFSSCFPLLSLFLPSILFPSSFPSLSLYLLGRCFIIVKRDKPEQAAHRVILNITIVQR